MTAPAPSPQRLSARAIVFVLVAGLVGLQLAVAGPAAAAVSAAPASVTEPGAGVTQLVFTVTRATGDDATIDYATADGTATAGQDYLAESETIVFSANQTSAQVRIDVFGDTLNEGDENLTLTLSGTGFADVVVTGTIHDDGDAAPRISIADTTVDEGNTGTNQATFAVTLNRPSGRAVTATYATANGSASAGADYTTTGGTVTFDPGDLSETVTVPVAGDTLDEINETFTVALTNPANATSGAGPATGVILDDDGPPTVSIADVTVAENAGPANFKVTLSATSGRDVTVYASTVSGTALPASDFQPRGGDEITISAGTTEATFPVTLVNDSTNESAETFGVTLSPGSGAVIERGAATGTITDDDPGPRFSINDVSIVEAATAMIFTVTLTGASAGQTFNVDVAAVEGTAKSPADYTATSQTLTFSPPLITTRTFTVTAVNETVAELDETFTVTLKNPTNSASLADDGAGLGTIQNDDGPPAVISIDDPTALESAGTANFTVNLAGSVAQPVLVNYTTKNATALATRDYDARSGTLTFAPGETTKTVDVPVTQDLLDEADETFTVELSDPVNAVFNDGVGTATITDDDAQPGLDIAIPAISEGDADSSTANIEVKLSAESGREVRVDYATANGTAIAGADYTPAAGTLVFLPGTTSAGETVKRIPVTITGDRLDELDETFIVRLVSPAINATVPAGLAAPGATATITDNDAAPVVSIADASLLEPDNSGTTDDRGMVFAVSLSAVSGQQVSVNFATADGTATAGAGNDYSANTNTLQIPAGEPGRSIVVEINNDTVDEPNETFTVTLSTPVNATLDADPAATGAILDDDGPPSLTIQGTTVGESVVGGKATVTVLLLPAAGATVTVNYATANGTAVAPGDYTPASGTLTFPAGETLATFDVTVVSDTLDEADEALTATLSSPAGGSATIGEASAGVAILDDDGPLVSAGNVSVTEGDTGTANARFTVSLSGASPQPVRVAYATSGGTATAPADFTATSGELTFAAGETAKTVDVPVVGDTIDEADEIFTLTLTSAVNATAGTTGVGTIVDNDQPKLIVTATEVATDKPSVTEGGVGVTTMAFAVRLDAATTRDVVVDYAAADGTARAGVDYLPTSGRLTFAPGEMTKTVLVSVLGDERDEVDETLILRLTNAVNGTIVDAAMIGTILDDDGPGYLMVASDGGIFAFGSAGFFGSTGNITLNQPIVGMARHPSGRGYWLVATDGGIFAFGSAGFFGSTGNIKLNKPIVGMAATPTGKGYWLVATDGGIFAFGDAVFQGSTGAIKLNQPIVGMASTPSGKGYWMVATDGGIFAFGDAAFQGSTGAIKLNKPVVGMAPTPSGRGYWLVATDGGIFAFGDAAFFGSTGAIKLNQPVVGMASTPSGKGYWLVATDGGIFAFGDATFLGSTGNIKLNKPIVGLGV